MGPGVIVVGPERIWLDVPFAEKDAAKAAGARWDQSARRWFAPRPAMIDLKRWLPELPIPELLPGEDRSLGSGLFVDLVPESCWFTNARSCVSAKDWERLRRMVLGRAGHRCEVCDAAEDRVTHRWLEVHERWAFDDGTRVQSLRRLICLCTPCHTVTHFGLARLKGLSMPARAHLIVVSGLTAVQADLHIADAFDVWLRRSAHTWALDLGILTEAGITPAPPPDSSRRPKVAREQLTRGSSPHPRPVTAGSQRQIRA